MTRSSRSWPSTAALRSRGAPPTVSPVRFRLEQRFRAPLLQVEDVFVDPAFLARLSELPTLGRPQLLDQDVEGDVVRQRVRYAFVGELASGVRAVVEPAKLTWVEESSLDRRSHRTEWRVVPDHYASLLRCSGTFQLEADGAERTRRVTEAEVRVRFPLVAAKVERAIVSGLAEHAVLEEQAVAEWLRSPP